MSRQIMKKRFRLIAVTAVLTAAMGFTALAAPVLYPDEKGSITLKVKDGDEVLSSGTVTIYLAGEPNEDHSGYVLSGEFAGAEVSLDDLEDKALVAGLVSFISENGLAGISEESVNAEGKVKFTELDIGLYLLIQTVPAEGYEPFTPFLVSVPYLFDGDYCYDVTAFEKTSLERIPETRPSETRPSETTPHHGGGGGSGGGGSSGGGGGSGGPGEAEEESVSWDLFPLPQTGQGRALLAAVVVMAAAGIGLLAVYSYRSRR